MWEGHNVGGRTMKRRPFTILFVSMVCFMLAPLYMGYQVWLQSLDPLTTLRSINPGHVLLSLLAIPVGVGVYRVTKWGYFSFLGLSSLIIIYFLFQYFTSPL